MSEIGILFSGPMVRAILEGWKTQTRRVMKPQPFDDGGIWRWQHGRHVVAVPGPRAFGLEEWAIWQECPYQVGQTLWVRETWADGIAGCPNGVSYRADHLDPLGDGPANPMKWRPSIHMPRWASRITLTITDVRVQRVQDISEEDAEEEGVVNCGIGNQVKGSTAHVHLRMVHFPSCGTASTPSGATVGTRTPGCGHCLSGGRYDSIRALPVLWG
jgi:hypothetical protein